MAVADDYRSSVQRITVALLMATLMYPIGVLAHRAFEFEHTVRGADQKMGEVRSGPRTSWSATPRFMLVREDGPPDPEDDLVMSAKSELAQALNRATALIPEEDVLWMVGQVYALNRAHAGFSGPAGMTS